MSWTQGPLRWPASAGSLHSRAQGVLGQLPATQDSAMTRLQGLAGRAQYRPHPLSEAAAALADLRSELDRLLVTGRCLTITPTSTGSANSRVSSSAWPPPMQWPPWPPSFRTGPILLPTGQLHALAWLVTGNSADALARQLAILCALLPLPGGAPPCAASPPVTTP